MGSASGKWLSQLDLTQPVDAATTERIFNLYDKDRNGYLDAIEAKEFVEEWCKHYGVKDPENAVQTFFGTFDADKDGKITKAELIGGPPMTVRERSKPVTELSRPSGVSPSARESSACSESRSSVQSPPPKHSRVPSSPFVGPPKGSIDLDDLEVKFRHCAVTRDRHLFLKKYPDCFVGNETVDLLLAQGAAKSRSEAVYYGNILMETGLFVSVSRDHLFKDEGSFYQFANRQIGGPTMAEVRAAEAMHERYLASKDEDEDVIIVEL